MATERQRRANARNAKKSTGPTSVAGKERVSQNARSHGLTTPPPSDEVLMYYRILLEDEEADPGDAASEADHAALTLAECEATCDRALYAETNAVEDMAIYLKTKGERDPLKLFKTSKTPDLENPAVLEMMMMPANINEEDGEAPELGEAELAEMKQDEAEREERMSGALRILYNINRHNLTRRRRRLERIAIYRQRAEGRRRRAFKAWLRVLYKYDNSKPNTRLS